MIDTESKGRKSNVGIKDFYCRNREQNQQKRSNNARYEKKMFLSGKKELRLHIKGTYCFPANLTFNKCYIYLYPVETYISR